MLCKCQNVPLSWSHPLLFSSANGEVTVLWQQQNTSEEQTELTSHVCHLPHECGLLMSVCTVYEFTLSSQSANDLLKHSERGIRALSFIICIHKQGRQSKTPEQCYLAFREVLRRRRFSAACPQVGECVSMILSRQ